MMHLLYVIYVQCMLLMVFCITSVFCYCYCINIVYCNMSAGHSFLQHKSVLTLSLHKCVLIWSITAQVCAGHGFCSTSVCWDCHGTSVCWKSIAAWVCAGHGFLQYKCVLLLSQQECMLTTITAHKFVLDMDFCSTSMYWHSHVPCMYWYGHCSMGVLIMDFCITSVCCHCHNMNMR